MGTLIILFAIGGAPWLAWLLACVFAATNALSWLILYGSIVKLQKRCDAIQGGVFMLWHDSQKQPGGETDGGGTETDQTGETGERQDG